jgi:hypothetical protein
VPGRFKGSTQNFGERTKNEMGGDETRSSGPVVGFILAVLILLPFTGYLTKLSLSTLCSVEWPVTVSARSKK